MVAFSSSLLYSSIMDLSVIKASLCNEIIWTFSQEEHLLRATYACPGENICESKAIEVDDSVKTCVLWTVNEKAFCKGNWVLEAYDPFK